MIFDTASVESISSFKDQVFWKRVMNAMTTEYASLSSEGSEHGSETEEKCQSEQDEENETLNGENEDSNSDYEDNYNMGDLPLEVITTVEPTNYAYPILKNMSNGVLTHRNIFTESERLVLKDIINKYRNIVDTRSRTREIYLEKQSVWQQIVEEYNSADNIMVRTEKELRKCWDNMKYRAKQAGIKKIGKSEDNFNNMEYLESTTDSYLQEAENQMKDLINNRNVKEESEECLYGIEGSTKMKYPQLINIKQDILSDHEENHQSNGEKDFLDKDNCEESEPELKRARQESPKLSSLLLAGPKKTKEKKSNLSNLDKTGNFPFAIPSCTKIYNVKKNKSNTPIDIPILPKGLSSCLSITNIPNPKPQITTSLPSNTHSEIISNSFSSSTFPDLNGEIKPISSLKKMLNERNITQSLGCKTHKSTIKKISANLDNDINFSNGFSNTNLLNGSNLRKLNGSCTNGEVDLEKSVTLKLLNQRLKFERLEHEAKMNLHEKKMQVKNYESQYWALKLKLLRAGKDSNYNMNISSFDMNGDFN